MAGRPRGWHDDGVDYLLAQVNIGRLLALLDSEQLADFVAALEPESVEALAAYVYSDTHRQVLKRRRQWFERMAEAYAALWWIPARHTPTTAEAEGRVLHLREFGPTPYAFTLREYFGPPDVADSRPARSPEDWTCPA